MAACVSPHGRSERVLGYGDTGEAGSSSTGATGSSATSEDSGEPGAADATGSDAAADAASDALGSAADATSDASGDSASMSEAGADATSADAAETDGSEASGDPTSCTEASAAFVSAFDTYSVCEQDADCLPGGVVALDGKGPSLSCAACCAVSLSDLDGREAFLHLGSVWTELGCEVRGCDDGLEQPVCREGRCMLEPEDVCPFDDC